VDRTTACGNPFLIAPNNERERNAACRAYAELIHGDPESPDVRKLATEYGLRVDLKFATPEAKQARDNALRQLERDVLTLHRGTSIRLMCHCAPKRCHAHAIAREIRRRLRTRGVDIHVDDGGWEGPPEERMDADMHADNEEAGEMTVDGTDVTAARQTDPGTPSHTPTDTTRAPRALPGDWVSRLFDKLLAHKYNGRNQRAYEEFMAQMATKAAGTAASSTETATEVATSREGADRERARAAEDRGAGAANRRKGPEASARKRAAVTKAAAERKQRAREVAERGKGSVEMARGAAEETAKGTEVPRAGTTTTTTTATREATTAQVLAEAETTAAADEWARPRDTLEPDDSHENGTAQATRPKTAHGDRDDNERAHGHDGTTRGRDDGTEDTRAEQRAGGDGDTTGGVKIRAPRVRNEEYRAAKRRRNDKYQGGKAT
jgi:hypothetical protein